MTTKLPTCLDEAEIVADLTTGVHQRLSHAAWEAKRAVDQITHVDCDPFERIKAARTALDEAERFALALRELRGEAKTR